MQTNWLRSSTIILKKKHPNNSEKANREVRLVPDRHSSLSPRLMAAAALVRDGASVADIGTDHAYLPIFLVEEGVSPRAIACDVNKGPLARAEANVEAAGLADRITLKLTDGLNGLETFAPDDILICGMGGELIIRILYEADFIRTPDCRLILQPMTSVDKLRMWLCENGFEIICESLAPEEERVYELICAHYTGERRDLTEAKAIAGFAEYGDLFCKALRLKLARLQKQINGFEVSGRDVTDLLELKAELEAMLEPHENRQKGASR